MSKVKIQGSASGSAVYTLTTGSTSTDRTITLPDGTGTLLTTDGDGSSLTGLSSFDPDGAVVINESGADVDFRVESDNDANSLFVQGSDGSVGMGIGTPDTSTYFGKVLHLAAGSNVGIMFNRTSSTAAKWSVGCNSGGSLVSAKEGVAQLEITSDGRGLSQFTAKAWVNYRGTSTNSIRDSHNVSSVTDNGTGDYTINFSNNIANSSYCVATSGSADQFGSTRGTSIGEYVRNSSYWRMMCLSAGEAGYSDHLVVHAVVFGD